MSEIPTNWSKLTTKIYNLYILVVFSSLKYNPIPVIEYTTNKYVQPITADDVNLILVSLIQSQTFMETKMAIIKNSLLRLLPKMRPEN
ncbi:hypothetical protein [Clostridium estertheticum]|uniref:hypothetical protein n=1 Tax=Clostridium estertheticum TaxID=238834 RepID=UPI001CF0F6D9|nr:hypothetical protein [Clostridium estertheticum]MCB2340344.1 hypothetical protein [Clostridium estertheticum]